MGEPAHVHLARILYWERRQWLVVLENRIMESAGGLDWLFRVKRIGFTA